MSSYISFKLDYDIENGNTQELSNSYLVREKIVQFL